MTDDHADADDDAAPRTGPDDPADADDGAAPSTGPDADADGSTVASTAGEVAGTEPAATRSGSTSRPRRRRRPIPWYRRGNVWFVLVLVTALGAWTISDIAEDRLYRFETEAGSVPAFCEVVVVHAGSGLFYPSGVPGADKEIVTWVARGREGHAALVAVAPEEVRADAEEVAAAFDELVADEPALGEAAPGATFVDEVRSELLGAVDGVSAEHRIALDRLDRFSTVVCGNGLELWPIEFDELPAGAGG